MSKMFKYAVGFVVALLGLAVAAPAQAAVTQATVAQAEVVAIAAADRRTYATASSPYDPVDPYVRMLGRQDTPTQAWEYVPRKDGQVGSTFTNQATHGCLMQDAFGPVNGPVVQRACTGGVPETWRVRPTAEDGVVLIVNVGSGGCLTQPSPFGSDNRLRVAPCDGVRQGFRLLALG